MSAKDAAERKTGDVQAELTSKHDFEALDNDARKPFGRMRLGWCGGLAKTRQVWCSHGESPGQRNHVAYPVCPGAVPAMPPDNPPSGAIIRLTRSVNNPPPACSASSGVSSCSRVLRFSIFGYCSWVVLVCSWSICSGAVRLHCSCCRRVPSLRQ